MDTGRGTSHTGACWGVGDYRRDSRVWGDWRGITLGEKPYVGDEGIEAANHHGMCIPM